MTQPFLSLSDRGKNGALRWIAGTFLILFFWQIIGGFLALPFLFWAGYLTTGDVREAFLAMTDLKRGDAFWNYIGVNVTFLCVWLGLWLTVRFIHKRALLTLVTPAPKINWARLAQGFGAWFVLVAIFQILEFVIYPARAQFTFDAARWLFFLPFILILTPMQTGAEELLFRGYWLQGIGRLTQNRIALVLVSGILFGLPHMLNPEVLNNSDSALLLFLNYAFIGAAFAFYTLKDNRLELALGAHTANNLFAALFVNYADSPLTTPAFFTNSTLDAMFGLVTLIISAIAFYLIVFRARFASS
ncbi:MAG: CPBP family intramembrane metalloprotease [Chloroflexi bacterium]|nr:CPBP family intramembrane metalloprotease [Chloroflexota bacterium]